MEKTEKKFSSAAQKFLEDCLNSYGDQRNIQTDNEKIVNSALIYEKFRVALEYQEEHLVFKNAISRILRRKYTYSLAITSEKLFFDLVNELSWANYLNPESLRSDETEKIKKILERYLIILKYSRSGFLTKGELQKTIINWLACEISEVIEPHSEYEILVNYAYSILKENISTKNTRITESENEKQLKLAIFNLIFKPDLSLIQYWVINTIYSGWRDYSFEEAKKFALSFEPNNNAINRVINNPYRTRYLQYTKRNIAPFILIKNLPNLKILDKETIKEGASLISDNLLHIYDSLIASAREKVWRGTIRALIFIFLTKISLAFLLEIPFDNYLTGSVHFLSLVINICLPPLLMLIMGTFVKSPPLKNRNLVSLALDNILYHNKIDDKIFSLATRKPSTLDKTFNFIYSAFSLGILGLVIWALIVLQFNLLSIVLFFIFVSAVSFFSFRIRNIALELSMKAARQDGFSSLAEFILLPFIRIGKYISERFTRTNPFTSVIDLFIEAPLKVIIKIFNSWLKFVNAKKEEIEF